MVAEESALVTLVKLVDAIPMPQPSSRRSRGHPRFYPDRLFLKALVIMVLRRLHKVHELLSALEQPTAEMQALHALLTEAGRYPARRTWERRLKGMPDNLPGQIACLGQYLVSLIGPWSKTGRAGAIDSMALAGRGGVWHKHDREKGVVPHSSIDTEANWTKSGWHGWVYGWKLHLVTTVAAVWIPLAAELTPANAADNEVACALLPRLPAQMRYILGDVHYNAPNVHDLCAQLDQIAVTTRYGPYPHSDAGVEVRRVFHKLRSTAIENFNEQFKSIFDVHGQVPTKGLVNTRRFVLGAILVYQLALLYCFHTHRQLRVGLKPLLRAA